MNTAFEVGGIFAIENQASPVFKVLADELEALDAKLERTAELFRTMLPAGIGRRLLTIGGAYSDAATAAEKSAVRMADANKSIVTSAENSARSLATSFSGVADAAKDQSEAVKIAWTGAFTGIDTGVADAAGVIAGGMSRISRGAARAARSVDALRLQLSHLATSNFETIGAIPMPSLPRGGGGGGGIRSRGARGDGSGGHGGGFHFSGESVGIPGGHVRGSGRAANTAIGGAILVGDAILEAATLEDIVTKVLITSQMNPGESPLTRNKDGQKIADMIKRGAVISGSSIKDVGEMFLGTEREFQGFDFDKKISTMMQMLPAISAEARLREESLKEAGTSLIGVLHQSGLFTPEEMVKGAKEFQFTTMATPVGLEQFKGALSYSMPLHNQIGMDTGTIMLMTALMQSSGITNTKSGTWLDAMFAKAQPETDVLGPLKKDQVQHNNALKMLGLLGDDGKQNWHVMGADGKEDWNASVVRFGELLHAGQEKIPESERNDVLKRAFGIQGGRAASLFSQENIIDQLKILKAKEEAFKGGDLTLSEYNQGSTIQQFHVAIQEFQTTMATLGTQMLPTVNAALKGFSDLLEKLPSDWEATKKMWGFGASKTSTGRAHFHSGSDPSTQHDYGLPDTGMGLFAPMAYRSGDNDNAISTLAQGVFQGLTMYAAGGGAMGGAGGGSGFINASYETGGGLSGRSYAGSGVLPGAASQGEHADYIRAAAARLGIDPRVAVAVAKSEGLGASWAGGDYGTSYGDFQMHFGGSGIRGMNGSGLGDVFNRETGLDARDPKNWKAVDEWALRYAARHGWSDWHGAARVGIGRMQGISSLPAVSAPPPRTVTPGKPAAPIERTQAMETHIHHVHIDGERVATAVSRRMVAGMEHPTAVGGPDTYGSWQGPATPLNDAA